MFILSTGFSQFPELFLPQTVGKYAHVLGQKSGQIIATGGGCVTREENYPLLHQNGTIIWLKRDLEKLPTDGRPLSQSVALEQMYSVRKPLYERFCDCAVSNNGAPADTVAKILKGY
jgi:shikimate dehydrogenase